MKSVRTTLNPKKIENLGKVRTFFKTRMAKAYILEENFFIAFVLTAPIFKQAKKATTFCVKFEKV